MSTALTLPARAMAYAFARNVASMQAAYIEWTRGDGADHGMAWISNTLCGPGLLPDAGSATAQEFFDCEMEKLDKLYPDVTMNPALPSPAWCASVDAELAATAEADAALSDVHVQAVRDAVAEALGNAYDCTRVWSAWGVGTMDQDDFQLVAEDSDRVAEIADAAIAAMRAPAPAITLPATAVAEGLERDGDALEQAS